MMARKLDTQRLSLRAHELAQTFKIRIIGQPAATEALIQVLEKFQSGFYDRTKPIASLLFLGPTGVGKTGTAEAFAEGLFNDPNHLMKVDCAEFQHSHEIAKLLGSPPGYLGHRETHPFFTNERVKKLQTPELPFTIIIFDEIEKASDGLWNLLLGILDKGTLTTGTNEVVDLTQTIIILTSNVGSMELATDKSLGFSAGKQDIPHARLKEIAMAAARRKFMPEFLNRLDHVVMFKTLTPKDIDEILDLELHKLYERVIDQSKTPFQFNVAPCALRQLASEGYDKRYNARNLKRTIDKYVALPLGRFVATAQVLPTDTVIIDYVDGDWVYYVESGIAADTAGNSL